MSLNGFKTVGYLDDFFYANVSESQCIEGQNFLIRFIERLGFTVNPKKVIAPTHTLQYLRIVIDLNRMCWVLPDDKLEKTVYLA